MAVTAAITLSAATCHIGGGVVAFLTITNGNAEDVEVSEVTPLAFPTGVLTKAPILLGVPANAAGNTTVTAGSTLVLQWGVTPLVPVAKAYSQAQVDASLPGRTSDSFVYDIGAEWKTSDGTTGVATTTTLTVSSP